jgi:hypothetical protein
MTLQSFRGRLLAFALLLGAAAVCGAAEMKQLLSRLPGEANAIAVLDVERMLKTPMAQKEGWKEKISSAYGKQPFIVAPGTKQVALAALIDPTTMESLWEVAVMDLDAAPAIDAIARGERGLPDMVGDKPAAWSPMNAFFIQLDPQILATVSPANRQFAARWARKKHTLEGAFLSGYLRTAATALESGTEFALAMDLEDVVVPRRAMARIKSGEFPCLVDNKDVDLNAIAKLVTTLKGITLRIDITTEAKATCSVDFGEDAAALKPVGKQLFLEALSGVGAKLEDAEGWTASVKRNALVLEGQLSTTGLRALFGIIQPPTPVQVAAQAPTARPPQPAPGAAGGDKPATPAVDPRVKLSQEYFATIDGILDRLAKSMGSGGKKVGLADGAAWMQRDARRISRLPIKDVDPDLVAWAANVSACLRDAAQPLISGTLQTGARTSVMTGNLTYSYDDYDNTDEIVRIEGERRQASLEERAKAIQGAAGVIRDLMVSRDQMRAQLVSRYNIEF